MPATAPAAAGADRTTSWAVADNASWPRTRRLGPWLGVALLVVVFLIPIDSIKLPIPLPVDARPDRVVIGVFLVLAVATQLMVDGPSVIGGHRYGLIEFAILAFVTVAVISVALNLPTLSALDEADESVKKFALLLSFAAFFLFLVNVLRPAEVPALVALLVGIAVLAAFGTILQYATGTNFFFLVSAKLLPPGTSVSSYHLLVNNGRPDITGPARHGLAISTMLAMTMPFAVAGATNAGTTAHRRLYGLAALIILIGCLTTLRRSGVVLPLASGFVVIALGGRRALPVVLGGIAVVLALFIVAPGTVKQVRDQFSFSNVSAQQSIGGRTEDYAAIQPDLKAHALLGRGFESYVAKRYRYVDNEYLQTVIGVGVVGLLAYLLLMLAAARGALRVRRRRRDTVAEWIAAACLGSVVAFALANALFDALSFPQAPYAFFAVLAIITLLLRDPAQRGFERAATSSSS
jgi:O-antigen ligase